MGLGSFKTKDDTNGVRVHCDGSIYVYLRRADNVDYKREINKLLSRSDRRSKNKDVVAQLLATAQENQEPRRQLAAKYLLVGWEGMVDDHGDFGEQGATMEYSPELAFEIFNHPRYKDFYDWVIEQCNEQENFRAEQIRESQGN